MQGLNLDKARGTEKILRKEGAGVQLEGMAVSFGQTDTISGFALRLSPETKRAFDSAPRPLILLVEDGTMHGFDLNPDAFYAADAIVMKNGGELSHIAIIARERGIIAISGVQIDSIPDGAQVTIEIVGESIDKRGIIKFE